jgi:HlyD family secretion protein
VDVFKSQIKSAQETYDLVKSGFRKEDIIQAQANLSNAEAVLQQARHELEQSDTQMKEMTVTAPMDAAVEVCNFRPGDILSPNQSGITLILPDRLWVRVFIPENYLGLLKENSKVDVKTDSYANEMFAGTIEQINRKAEYTPRNVQTVEERVNTVFGVKIKLENSSNKLRAGMSADVIFPDIPMK